MESDQIKLFFEINKRLGVSEQLIEILVAFMLLQRKSEKKVNFLSPTPSLEKLISSPQISDKKKSQLKSFYTRHKQNNLNEDLINLLLSYAGIFYLRGQEVIYDKKHLAACLGKTVDAINFMGTDKYKRKYGYHTVSIPKRSGGYRKLSIPNKNLKKIQTWILENILSPIPKHAAAHGFRSSYSIISNASQHVDKKILISIDIKDFFPSITFSKVLKLFLSLGYTYSVSVLLTTLCTFEGVLPQGSPTSPEISNLICRKLDKRLYGLAQKTGFTYTRYADDISFSSSEEYISPVYIINKVKEILSEEGFVISSKKSKVNRSGSRQVVTGIVVNRKLNVKREYRRKLKAIIHNSVKLGLASQNREECTYFYNQIRGKIAFVQGINKAQGDKLLQEFNLIPRPKNESN